MAKQPALVRASKTEMASQDDRGPGDCMEINDFGERSPETESKNVQVTKRAPKNPGEIDIERGHKGHQKWERTGNLFQGRMHN